jgi:hypothetical protein
MEEMLLTWRTASPTGKELFGVIPQLAIERGIWGGDSNPTGVSLTVTIPSLQRTEYTFLGNVWSDIESTSPERT